jgi:hypothetical protein
VGFVVDKVALGQFFSQYFGFLCQFSFHRLLHTRHHLSSGAGTIDQLVADVPSGLSLTPPQQTKKKKKKGSWKSFALTRDTDLGGNVMLETCVHRSDRQIGVSLESVSLSLSLSDSFHCCSSETECFQR